MKKLYLLLSLLITNCGSYATSGADRFHVTCHDGTKLLFDDYADMLMQDGTYWVITTNHYRDKLRVKGMCSFDYRL